VLYRLDFQEGGAATVLEGEVKLLLIYVLQYHGLGTRRAEATAA
jgi:hypothetical protein